MSAKFTGQLYQFRTKTPLSQGAYVEVNGPWDTYGAVVKSSHEPAPTPGSLCTPQECEERPYLNLVRGVQKRQLEKPVYRF